MGPTFVLVALGVVLAAIAYRVLGSDIGGAKFVVSVNATTDDGSPDASVGIKGAVPGKAAADVRRFVSELGLPEGAKFWGVRDGDRIAIRFRDVPENLQQRIRNYVYN